MSGKDPLDVSGQAASVQRWLELVKPQQLLPDTPPACPVCLDRKALPSVDDAGHVRYRACPCVVQQDVLARQERLAEQLDMPGQAPVRLGGLAPVEEQYAAYRAIQHLLAHPCYTTVLCGHAGTGKTQFAMAAAWAMVEHRPVAFHKAAQLVRLLRSGGHYDDQALEERITRLAHTGLLVIDGLGTESVTQWTQSAFLEVVDARWQARRPTLLTTTISLAEMGEMLLARFLDLSRARVAIIPGTPLVGEPMHQRANWGPGALLVSRSRYNCTQEAGFFVCPRCQSRPCLDVCPEPRFGAPEKPA